MGRGRPKGSKNKPKNTNTNIVAGTNKCDICNCLTDSSLIYIRLEGLTGKSTYHRDCRLDKLKICGKCANELNEVIDKFLIKKNPALKKFELGSVHE